MGFASDEILNANYNGSGVSVTVDPISTSGNLVCAERISK
jgi:hypothetical protein